MNGGDNRPHKGPRDFAEKAPPWAGGADGPGQRQTGTPRRSPSQPPSADDREPLVAVSKIRHTAGTGEHSRQNE